MSTASKRPRNVDKYEELAYHLYADMIHDHGTRKDTLFREIVGNLGDLKDHIKEEDYVLKYFIDKEPIRKSARLLFTTTETTALFQGNKKHAVLFSTPNDTIGIVHDNGSKIFKQLGTRNLITFGSVLDQAGKPISPADEPVYYDGKDQRFRISAAEYGFSSLALSNVIIYDFRGGAQVKCVFEYSDITREDAIAMKMLPRIYLKSKPINSTDIDRAGYFTSIAEIESLDGFNNRETLKKYYMGKALGDIMLVASISPSIRRIPNPFIPNGVSRPALLNFNTDEKSTFNILHYVLKTTDRLNYVRAVIKGVHSILQVMSKGGNESYYEFFPGMIEDESIRLAHYISMIGELATKAQEKYNALIRSFINSLDGKLLKRQYSMFHKQLINGNLPRFSTDPTLSRSEIAAKLRDNEEKNKVVQQERAGDLILKIINALEQIKQRVLYFFRKEYNNIQTNKNLSIVSNTYSKLCDLFNCLTPQRTEILHNGSMIMDIIVIKMKKQYINLEFEGVYRIQLYNAFKAIGENQDVETIPFLTKASAAVGPQAGGAELEPKHEYYDLFNDELMQSPYGTDQDYVFVNPKRINLINHYPLLISFMKFVGKDSKQSCNLIWNAYRRRFSNKIFDHEFLRRTCNEMLDFVRVSYSEEDYYRIESIISVKDYTNNDSGENNKVTPATLLFNAFTFHINAQNARLYGFLTDESIESYTPIYEVNELSLDYENLSNILKEIVYMMDPIIFNIENSTPIPTSPGTTSPILFTNKAPNTPPKNRKIKNISSNSNSNFNAEVSLLLDSQEAQTQEAQISAERVSRPLFSSPKIPGSTSPKIPGFFPKMLVLRPSSRPSSKTSPRQYGGSRNKTNKKKRRMYRNKTKRARKSLIDV